MMKEKFQFYKNIILVVASALTLVAVTFAWFSTPSVSKGTQIKADIDNKLINVQFYESEDNGTTYQAMSNDSDITIDGVAGTFEKYKIIVKTTTSDKLKLSMCIDDLPKNMNAQLADAVCVKYDVFKATKRPNGAIEDGSLIMSSTGNSGYVSLSDITNGILLNDYSIGSYQQSQNDYFVVYYEIGISETAPSTIQGMSSSLGSVRLSAQLQG